jgi:apolipoprotein D and lipocalin family protein
MKITRILNTLAFAVLFAASISAQSPAKLEAVSSLDIKRYSGKWYEIAKYPNRFQKKCVANTTATYTEKKNGRIEVKNECLEKDGRTETAIGEAKIDDKKSNSKLKVRFAPGALSWLPFVWANYWVIDLDPNYEYAVIGEPKRDYFWILSRKPTMDDRTYQDILRRAEKMGFNAAKVERSPQNAEVLKGAVIIKN